MHTNSEFVPIERAKNIPDVLQDEMIETSEIPDEWELEPPKNHRELNLFIEKIHPSFNWLIWWTKTYDCNNWRKMHGLPMSRRMKK